MSANFGRFFNNAIMYSYIRLWAADIEMSLSLLIHLNIVLPQKFVTYRKIDINWHCINRLNQRSNHILPYFRPCLCYHSRNCNFIDIEFDLQSNLSLRVIGIEFGKHKNINNILYKFRWNSILIIKPAFLPISGLYVSFSVF